MGINNILHGLGVGLPWESQENFKISIHQYDIEFHN